MAPDVVCQLVRAAASGEQRAWDRLEGEFGGLIWAIARAHHLSGADAADVAQTAWLALIEHLDSLHDPTGVGAWLATTARRECLRVLRANDRVRPFGDDLPEEDGTDMFPVPAVFDEARDEALWRGFAALGDRDQALLRLLVADPRPSYQEISAALDMPIGAIGPTRQRALQRLKRELVRQGSHDLMTA
jgi:RNA polymerase sigma factor (sigma-70 family)